jgi:hypothetical protein
MYGDKNDASSWMTERCKEGYRKKKGGDGRERVLPFLIKRGKGVFHSGGH